MARPCSFDGCLVPAIVECDNCEAHFCSDHGSEGGDDSPFDDAIARPSMCFQCGGFNADA
jgi:hypothetical protein